MKFFFPLQGIWETSFPFIFHLLANLLILPFYLIRNTGFDDTLVCSFSEEFSM